MHKIARLKKKRIIQEERGSENGKVIGNDNEIPRKQKFWEQQ